MSRIQATLKRNWEMIDGSTESKSRVRVGPGTVELERIPNPYGHAGNWLVIRGTKIGMAEGAWKQWINGTADVTDFPNVKAKDLGLFEIILEENGQLVPPPKD